MFWRQVLLDLATGEATLSDSGYPTADAWLDSAAFVLWVRATLPADVDPAAVRASLRARYGGE